MTANRFLLPRRIWAIASTTFTELLRLKLFYAVCGIGLLLIGSSVFVARFSFQEEFQILKDVSLGTMTIFSSVLAIIATANLIPRDVEDRTAYAVLAKAVPRFEYVLGKLLGSLCLIAVAVAVMGALMFVILATREHSLATELMRGTALPHAETIDAAAAIHRAASFHTVAPAIAMIFVKAAVLTSLTLFISTFATSNAFTIMVMVLVYFVAHLQPIAREYWLQSHDPGLAARSFLGIVAIAFPDLQALDFTDAISAGVAITLPMISKAIALGAFYIVMYASLAIAAFSGREL